VLFALPSAGFADNARRSQLSTYLVRFSHSLDPKERGEGVAKTLSGIAFESSEPYVE